MEIQTEKRPRNKYKAKYMTMKGYCLVLIGIILFMSGVLFWALRGNNALQQRLADRPMVIIPDGDTK